MINQSDLNIKYKERHHHLIIGWWATVGNTSHPLYYNLNFMTHFWRCALAINPKLTRGQKCPILHHVPSKNILKASRYISIQIFFM